MQHSVYLKFLGLDMYYGLVKKFKPTAASSTASSASSDLDSASNPTTAMTNNPQLLQDPALVTRR